MKQETYICDVCGVTKQLTNHWWVMFLPWERTPVIQPFGDSTDWIMEIRKNLVIRRLDLCGQKCVLQKLSEVMK